MNLLNLRHSAIFSKISWMEKKMFVYIVKETSVFRQNVRAFGTLL